MENGNQTILTEFILNGFPHDPKTRMLFCFFLIFMYMLTFFGNVILICTVVWNPHMHTPMYYFLCNLSVLDLFYSSSTVPKMLLDLNTREQKMSFGWCMSQMYIVLFLGGTECMLLAVMAFDRCVAICLPLHYMVIMSWKRCNNITVTVWLGSFLLVILPTFYKPILFCRENRINHFVCEILAVLELACGDTFFYKTALPFASLFTILVPFVFIVVSYIPIIVAVIKMQSVAGRTKAFSTCASHLTVVLIFYGTSLTMYLGPTNHFSSNKGKYISVCYGVVTPMLNPLIYSLRNNEVKEGIKKLFTKKSPFHALCFTSCIK